MYADPSEPSGKVVAIVLSKFKLHDISDFILFTDSKVISAQKSLHRRHIILSVSVMLRFVDQGSGRVLGFYNCGHPVEKMGVPWYLNIVACGFPSKSCLGIHHEGDSVSTQQVKTAS